MKLPWGNVVTRITGEGPPILVLHGGPGGGMVSVEGFERLPCQLYGWDQLGCGGSDKPDDPSLWTMQRCVEEVEAVRAGFGLELPHVLGHSWGAMLALEYALHYPVRSLMLLGGVPGASQYDEYALTLRRGLPDWVQRTLEQCEERADYTSLTYNKAMLFFYARHYLRFHVSLGMPATLARMALSMETMLSSRSFVPMWGPDQFRITGTLKDWNAEPRLGGLKAPTLVMCGRHDVAGPPLAQSITHGIPGAQLDIFENSAHFAMEEEPDLFRQVVMDFIQG